MADVFPQGFSNEHPCYYIYWDVIPSLNIHHISHTFLWFGVHVPSAARGGARSLKELVRSTKRKFETKNFRNFSNELSPNVLPRCQMLPEGRGAVPTTMMPRKAVVRRPGGAKCRKVTRKRSR